MNRPAPPPPRDRWCACEPPFYCLLHYDELRGRDRQTAKHVAGVRLSDAHRLSRDWSHRETRQRV
jgi:hypothetical protein